MQDINLCRCMYTYQAGYLLAYSSFCVARFPNCHYRYRENEEILDNFLVLFCGWFVCLFFVEMKYLFRLLQSFFQHDAWVTPFIKRLVSQFYKSSLSVLETQMYSGSVLMYYTQRPFWKSELFVCFWKIEVFSHFWVAVLWIWVTSYGKTWYETLK